MEQQRKRAREMNSKEQELEGEVIELKAKLKELEAELKELEAEFMRRTAVVDEWTAKVVEAHQKGDKEEEAFAKEQKADAERQKADAARQQEITLSRVKDVEAQIAALRSNVAKLHVLSKASIHHEGVPSFVASELDGKRVRLDSEEEKDRRVIQFSQRLFGDPTTPKAIRIRDCHRNFARQVHNIMPSPPQSDSVVPKYTSVFVAGTRGIGKSVFGALMALELMDRGCVVLYEHKRQKMILIGENVNEHQRQVMDKCFELQRYEKLSSEKGVYVCLSATDLILFKLLTDQSALVHVQDLGDDRTASVNRNGACHKLILSSPNNGGLIQIDKTVNWMKMLYMPLWSLDELQEVREIIFPNLSKEQVDEGFRKFGGVPRMVLENYEKADEHVFSQIRNVTLHQLQDIMRQASYCDLPSQQNTGFLVHVVPTQDAQGFKCDFASEYVSRLMAERFLNDHMFQMQQFIAQVKDIPQFAVWRGYMLEALTHRTIPTSPTVHIRLLKNVVPKHPKSRPVTLPVIRTVVFREVEDLTSFEPNVYYKPFRKTYPTIDSFILIDGHILDPALFKSGQLVLLFIQVTVSASHEVDGVILKRIYETVCKLVVPPNTKKNALLQALAFITPRPPNGIQQYQPLKSSLGVAYKRPPPLDQYSVSLGNNFDVIWEQWKV